MRSRLIIRFIAFAAVPVTATRREMKEQGGFTWVRDAMPTADLKAVFGA